MRAYCVVPLLLASFGCASGPDEGTIIYHFYGKSGGLRKDRTFTSTTVVFTTAGHELDEQGNSNVHVEVDSSRSSTGNMARAFQATRPVTKVLDRETFGSMWAQLEDAGLFRLPRYGGASPPKDRSYFLIRSGGQRWIYRAPETPKNVKSPDDPQLLNIKYWRDSTLIVTTFVNLR